MIAADASAAIAAFAEWHAQHDAAQRALARRPAIVAHAAFETYSVLTRIPEPQRIHGAAIRDQLDRRFGDRWLALSAGALRETLRRLEELGISGGATYDGLIGMTAAAQGATLVTLDTRALATYARVGVDFVLVT